MTSDVKYSNLFAGRPVQSIPHELGFRTFHGSDCGFPTCLRTTIHFHCRTCGYGTSQISNLVPHRRLCLPVSEMPVKDVSRATGADPNLSQYEIVSSSQGYPYYSTASSSGSTSQGSKIITTQQSAMFNFVIPTQTPQYSGLYGGQTVFPNPSLFSPSSFNSFGQIDPSWLPQSRLLSSNSHSGTTQPPDMLGNTRHFDKLESSISPSCCSTAIGLCSPLTAEAYKVVSKELQTKMDTQSWFSSSSLMGLGGTSSCKFADTTPACSISLLLLEQNDLKQGEECINVDELCFDSPKGESKKEELSSCMQDTKKPVFPSQATFCNKAADFRPSLEENIDLESLSSSEESDIIVEESESEGSGSEVEVECAICKACTRGCVNMTTTTPVTSTSHVPVVKKLAQLVSVKEQDQSSICHRCCDLVNTIDCLEVKLNTAREQLFEVYRGEKENVPPTEPIEPLHPVQPCDVVKDIPQINDKLRCQVCGKSFSSLNYLSKHEQYHTKSFSYYCEYCGRGFTLLRKLENHILVHKSGSRYQCEVCGRQFIQKHALTDHIRRHRGEYKYRCNVCDKGFIHKKVLEVHLQVHSDRPGTHMCHHCGKQFRAEANLSVHIRLCSGNLSFKCERCDKAFALDSLLRKHVKLKHEGDYVCVCQVCKKGFMKESDLKVHLRSHSEDKPFKCSHCERRYKSQSNLNQHFKSHSDKTFKCDACEKEFTRKDVLEDHKNQHEGKAPYKCTVCWKSLTNRNNFANHMKRHAGTLKQTPCSVCGKLFTKGLKAHMASHSNIKPFACKLCSALFTVKSSLNKHVNNKHRGAEFKNKSFT